jgi:protease-4
MESNEIPPAAPTPPRIDSPPPPPPPLAPPGVMAPLPPRPRKSRAWMIVAIVLFLFLCISLLGNFSQFMSSLMPVKMARMTSSSSAAGPRLDEVTLEDNDSNNKIAVIDVDGVITSGAIDQGGFSEVDLIKEQLNRAREDSRVKAVLLRVDSPGGEVLASDEIYRLLREFQEPKDGKPGKPVIASMGNLAASGGYYISSASRWIVANEMTITGSIGVIMHTWNYRGLMNKVGLQPEVFKSGKHKDMLSGERNPDEIPPEEREMIQKLIMETYGRFTKVVDEGRTASHEKNRNNSSNKGKTLVDNWKDYADGRVLSGKEAEELGFVDQVGNFDDAVATTRTLTRIAKADLIQYRLRRDLSDLFRLFGKTEAPVVKLDLGVELPKLQVGQLYFLSPTFVR